MFDVTTPIAAFQFTHPVRGATCPVIAVMAAGSFQFTHPVRGATNLLREYKEADPVSIHAPREGCDLPRRIGGSICQPFQFTHPVRGATSTRLLW